MSRLGEHKTAIWSAVISAIAVVVAAFVTGFFGLVHPKTSPTPSPPQKPQVTTPFTGIVTTIDGTPIVHARVQASIDQQVPESSYTDSDGEFHFELPLDIKLVHVTVYADGYSIFDRDVNANRTGAEVMVLTKRSEHTVRSERKPTPKTRTETAGNSPPIQQPSAPVQPQQTCGPGVVNCNFAPNQGHQDTYYAAPHPPPTAMFRQKPLPAINMDPQAISKAIAQDDDLRKEGEAKLNPGTLVSIEVPSDFQNPAFIVQCDTRCGPSAAFFIRGRGSFFLSSPITFEYSTRAYDSNNFAIKFRVPDGMLGPEESIQLRVRSATRDPAKVTSLTSIIAN